MTRHLTIDFGSTYTKAVLFDLETARILGTGYAPSTVEDDVRNGLAAALEAVGGNAVRDVPCFACSSAAGGLRMVAVGLVPSLSLEAAQRAALGAGAKVVGAYGYKLTESDINQIIALAPDILLLAGGTDGGDEETISHNAVRLAGAQLDAPVIVAGNHAVSSECATILRDGGMTAIVTPNILPEVDRLDVEPVHAKIRDVFMDRIVHAKGIDRVSDEVNLNGPLVPTPSAILGAARLLAEGTGNLPGAGDTVVIDIGGATTDVHSIASGAPRTPGVVQRGLPELYAKRTVEGDLGMRVNAPTVLSRASAVEIGKRCAELFGGSVEDATILRYVERVSRLTSYVPTDPLELAIDGAIAACAVELAMTRHAGRLREVVTTTGTVLVQEGKDLTGTKLVLGVGGVLAHGPHKCFILEAASINANCFSLGPRLPKLYVDQDYVLFGVGLLAERYPEAALRIARNQLKEL